MSIRYYERIKCLYFVYIIHLNCVYITDIIYFGGEQVPIRYKIDVLSALKAKGYSTYKLRKEKLFGERTIQKIRAGELVNAENLSLICKLLNCQPGDILEYLDE
ncbi:MAG: helix-turn-helix transcriptional regulator [Ruminococcus sp.]|nr:helix-turn-helix transcriptional regulator [Ruminococcus sp.]